MTDEGMRLLRKIADSQVLYRHAIDLDAEVCNFLASQEPNPFLESLPLTEAAVAAQVGQPESGMVMVPREPTRAMTTAGVSVFTQNNIVDPFRVMTKAIYKAMLSAHGERKE